jgi:hypothetical protein
MKKWGWVLTGSIAVLLLLGGDLFWRHQQAATAAQAQQSQQLARNTKVARRISAQWTNQHHHYVKASVDADGLKQLTVAQHDAAKNARGQAERQATANELALSKLKRAYAATKRVNALFDAPALVDAKLTGDPLIAAHTTTITITKATANGVNPTLAKTLANLRTLASAQVAERTTLKAAVAKIADDGTLKADVTSADLQAFQTTVAGLKYPALAASYHSLQTAVATKLSALNQLKALDAKERDRRILYLVSGVGTHEPEMAMMWASWISNGRFVGDTYQADVTNLSMRDDLDSTEVGADVVVKADGTLVVHEHQSGASKTYGNVLKDMPADLATQRPDPNSKPAPKITTFATLKTLLQQAGASIDADAQARSGSDLIGVANADGSGYYYDKRDSGIYTCHYPAANAAPIGSQLSLELTAAVWQKALGQTGD